MNRPPRARRAAVVARLRARAPRHPAGPEVQIKHAVTRLFMTLNHDIRARVRRIGHYLQRSARHDAAAPHAHPLAHALSEARALGKRLVRGPGFHSAVFLAAAQAAAHTAAQVRMATGTHKPIDLGEEARELATRVIDRTDELVDDAIDRADDVIGEWLELDPELSERAEDLDALDEMIADDQDRNTGKAIAAAGLAFGFAFAVMNRSAQEDAGVGRYMWLSQKDSRVRPAHRDLDEEVASWDDPPLKASESDNEEDDHAGEDYNCRCVASPLTPEDERELGLD